MDIYVSIGPFFLASLYRRITLNGGKEMKETRKEKAEAVETEKKKDVIAHRKSCDARGTGLSHYILMDDGRAKK